jgi:hypothetical protein
MPRHDRTPRPAATTDLACSVKPGGESAKNKKNPTAWPDMWYLVSSASQHGNPASGEAATRGPGLASDLVAGSSQPGIKVTEPGRAARILNRIERLNGD